MQRGLKSRQLVKIESTESDGMINCEKSQNGVGFYYEISV
jgi:hypothetical protein